MAAAIAITTIGGLLAYSGIKGVSIGDMLRGLVGDKLNPAGGKVSFGSTAVASDAITGAAVGGLGGGDAKALVDSLVRVAQTNGGAGVYVVSAHRPGDPLDHGSNDADKAARDIAVQGVDAIKGPPMPELDRAVVAIGKALGRNYKPGVRIVDTFTYQGLRVQVIWRTPEYGGHLGHIHVGARKL